MNDITYDVPDVEPDERTGLSVWPVLANGKEIGRVVEREDGYQAKTDAPWFGPVRPFRDQAISDVKAKA